MFPDDRIEKNIKWIKKLRDNSKGAENEISDDAESFFSKWAVLELCGWVEESMDALVLGVASEKMADPGLEKNFKAFVKGIHGFTYDNDFRRLLGMLIGFVNIKIVEARISRVAKDSFVTSLNKLGGVRNELAHTFVKGTQKTIFAISSVEECHLGIREGLRAYKEEIDKILFTDVDRH